MADRADALIASWRVELPEVLGPNAELIKRVMILAGDLREATERELAEFGLTPAEFDVLAALRRSAAPYQLKPNEVSRALLLSSGGTSNIVKRLAERGLVRRDHDPRDGRGTLIRLTDDGRSLVEEALRANTLAHEELFADVPAETVAAATSALRDVFAVIDRPRRGRAPRGAPASSASAGAP